MIDLDNSADRHGWLHHEYTVRYRDALRKEHAHVTELLVSACRASQDPGVIRAFMQYQASVDNLDLFTRESRDDESEP